MTAGLRQPGPWVDGSRLIDCSYACIADVPNAAYHQRFTAELRMQQYVPGREARRFPADQIYSEIDFYVDIRKDAHAKPEEFKHVGCRWVRRRACARAVGRAIE